MTLDGQAAFDFQPVELKIPKPDDVTAEDVKATEQDVHIKPKFVESLSDVQISKGNTIILECRVTGKPRPEITWYRNGKRVMEGDRHHMEIRPGDLCILTIRGVNPDDEGTYTCKATNPAGEDSTSATFQISAKGSAPEFTKELQDTVVLDGMPARFEVRVDGNPEPVVEWFKEGKQLKPGRTVETQKEGNIHKLLITNCRKDDSGRVVCKAKNTHGEAECTSNFSVTLDSVPPKFTKRLYDLTVKLGSDIQLSVNFVGTPEPKVKWYLDDEEITKQDGFNIGTDLGSSVLFLNGFTSEDYGNYKCVIMNDAGQASTATTLSGVEEQVLPLKKPAGEAPKFIKKLTDLHVIEGDAVRLEVIVSGTPKPSVQWKAEGQPIEETRRVHVMVDGDKHILQVEEVVLDDEAEYKCVVSNDHGTLECSAELLVDERSKKPEFIKELTNVKTVEGEKVKFVAEIEGIPKPEVLWFKNNVLIEAGDRFEASRDKELFLLTLQECTLKDTAEIKCTARNTAGEVSSVANLVVESKPKQVMEEITFTVAPKDENPVELKFDIPQEKDISPQFLQKLEDKEVMEGSKVDLEVDVGGQPKPTVEWLKDGQPVKPGERIRIESDERVHTLSITNVKLDDEAEYTCIAKNIAGEASCKSEVLVEEDMREPQFVTRPRNIEITEGDIARFEAVVSGLPLPEIEWLKDGKPIEKSHRFQLDFDENHSILTIMDAKLNDEGEYTCILSSKAGKDSCKVELLVNEAVVPPEFVRKMSTIELYEGDVAQFDVRVSGTPAPDVQWFKDDEPLSDSDRIEIRSDDDQRSIVIRNCIPNDGGRYRCTATNEAGHKTCYGELTINSKPFPPYFSDESPSIPTEFEAGGDMTLEATVRGRPAPDVHWEKDNKPIKESTHYVLTNIRDKYTLTIKGASPKDSGVYTCIAKNDAGAAKRTYNLDIEGMFCSQVFCLSCTSSCLTIPT